MSFSNVELSSWLAAYYRPDVPVSYTAYIRIHIYRDVRSTVSERENLEN